MNEKEGKKTTTKMKKSKAIVTFQRNIKKYIMFEQNCHSESTKIEWFKISSTIVLNIHNREEFNELKDMQTAIIECHLILTITILLLLYE